MKKRALAFALCLVMTLSLLPIAAMAQEQYTISFHSNVPKNASTAHELTGTMPDITVDVSGTVNIPPCGYMLPGYDFVGWNTQKGGSGTSYTDKGSVDGESLDGDTLLYAQWQPKTYTVTFDGNGGIDGETSQVFEFDKPKQLTNSTWEKEGLNSFLCWAGPDGSLYANRATVINLCTVGYTDNTVKGITLTAQWVVDGVETRVVITNDNKPVSGLPYGALFLRQNVSEYRDFTEAPAGSGIYVYYDPIGELPSGEYNIILAGYDTGGETVVKEGFAFLSYFTVEIESDAHSKAWLVDSSGNHVNKLTRVKRGSTLTIGSNTEEGYSFDYYEAIGVEPSNWSENTANQSIQIKGQVLLKAHTVCDHTHSWADAWTSDDTAHWHECEGDCFINDNSRKDGYGAHEYTDDADNSCNTCGYTRTATPPSSGMTAPLITDPTADKTVIVTEGNTGTLSVTAIGTEPMSYQWQIDRKDGEGFKDIPDANSSSYTTSPAELENDGYQYRCIVSNEAGSATSPTFTLRVIEYTDIPQTGDNSHLGLWLGLALLSMVGFVVAMVQRRKIQG